MSLQLLIITVCMLDYSLHWNTSLAMNTQIQCLMNVFEDLLIATLTTIFFAIMTSSVYTCILVIHRSAEIPRSVR